MTTYNSPAVSLNSPVAVHGEFKAINHLHETVTVSAGLTTADTLNIGYLPPNAVVTSVKLKAPTQLDSNGAPTLAFNMGISGTPALFKSAITTVGRAAGASVDETVAAAGLLYKNTTGSKVLVTVTPSANAATGVAGTIEAAISYFVEE